VSGKGPVRLPRAKAADAREATVANEETWDRYSAEVVFPEAFAEHHHSPLVLRRHTLGAAAAQVLRGSRSLATLRAFHPRQRVRGATCTFPWPRPCPMLVS